LKKSNFALWRSQFREGQKNFLQQQIFVTLGPML
jgi:hypothetical protein